MSKGTSKRSPKDAEEKVVGIKVTTLHPDAEWVVAVVQDESGRRAYRGILPLELCNHTDHTEVMEAIACGSPTAIALAAVLHEIGKDALQKLGREAGKVVADAIPS